MPKGYLIVETKTANGTLIIGDALVCIKSSPNDICFNTKTNAQGTTDKIELDTVDKSISLDQESLLKAYKTYDIEIKKDGFITQRMNNVQIFDNETTLVFVLFTPIITQDKIETSTNDDTFFSGSAASADTLRESNVIRPVTIPETITVHLGTPTSIAENLTVRFTDYIKNVTCSEIYPTWPKEAIIANVLCIISIALNRIYTEWYLLKGYPYQITSSPGFDQAFVKNRNIFANISEIVDEIFNEYLSYQNFVEPLFASFCDGKSVQCNGLEQWGSYTLAKEGNNALEILKTYYGDRIEIKTSNEIKNMDETYPGKPLKIGMSNSDVYLMQRRLNRISLDYPAIPKIFPANGIFDLRMEDAVKAFQKQFNLTADGIIGKSTWYKINFVYISVKKLAELQSEGETLPEEDLIYPGTPIKEGDRGMNVVIIQYLLATCAQFYEFISPIVVDGRFGYSTRVAVVNFQKNYNLFPDGIVGEKTWNKLVEVFNEVFPLMPTYPEIVPYPNAIFKLGSKGVYVRLIQQYLTILSFFLPEIKPLEIDGIFGPKTKENIIAFQKKYGLDPDGIVGKETWNKLITVYQQIFELLQYPNTLIKQGEKSDYVRYMQYFLNELSAYYPELLPVQIDGIFGTEMKKAVILFQKQFGLEPDGVIGKATWNKIISVYLNSKYSDELDMITNSLLDMEENRQIKLNMYK